MKFWKTLSLSLVLAASIAPAAYAKEEEKPAKEKKEPRITPYSTEEQNELRRERRIRAEERKEERGGHYRWKKRGDD